MLIETITARLGDGEIPFAGTVEGALEYDAIRAEPSKLQTSPRAFVIPLGRDGGTPQGATSVHSQLITRRAAVILAISAAGDATGKRSSLLLEDLEDRVIDKLTGWQPADFVDPLAFMRQRLLYLGQGTAFSQLDFQTSHLKRTIT